MIPTLIYAVILLLINFPVVALVERLSARPGVKNVYAVSQPLSQRRREILNAMITTPVHAILFCAFILSNTLKTSRDTFLNVPATFLLTFLWTEVWHYASHYAMHLKALHFIHREHHLSRVTGPWTSVSFSFLEKFIFSFGILGGLAIVSQLAPLSVLGIFLYYVLYFITNTLGHSNIEIRKPRYYRRFMGRVFNTPSYHALHHARYVRNYGLITPWLDRVFGTEWSDVSEVQTRAAEGRPLTKINEKCPPSQE